MPAKLKKAILNDIPARSNYNVYIVAERLIIKAKEVERKND